MAVYTHWFTEETTSSIPRDWARSIVSCCNLCVSCRADSEDAPALLDLAGGFDFSGCSDCTSFPPFEQTEMRNSETSAIVLQAIPCMCGLYEVRFERRKRFAQGAHRRSQQALGDRRVSRIACSSARSRGRLRAQTVDYFSSFISPGNPHMIFKLVGASLY